MKFDVFGPFDIACKKKPNIQLPHDNATKVQFRQALNTVQADLANASGVFVLYADAGKGYQPWYVGQTTAQGFAKEIYGAPIHKFGSAVASAYSPSNKNVKFCALLFAAMTPKKKFKALKPQDSVIDFVESLMIGMALEKNPAIVNIQHASMLKKLTIPGILGSAHGGTKSVQLVKSLFA
jgi:hypothetical protein